MYKLFFIAKNNMKKQKSDMCIFFVLTLLAAFLIFDCASAIMGVGKVLDRRFDDVNGAHVLLINGDTENETKCAEKAFENKHIIDYESTPILNMKCEFRNKKDKDYSSYEFMVQSFEEEPKYLNPRLNQNVFKENDIIIPFFLKNSFSVGDTLQIKIGDDVYDYNVAGFSEDPYFCSSINLTVYYTYMSQKMFDKLGNEHSVSIRSSMVHKGVIDESELSDDFTTDTLEHEINEEYKNLITPYSEEQPEANYLNYRMVNWQMMRGGSQFIPMITMSVMLVFAILILIIAIVIISFSIKNFMQRNMKNTGILEASGYTVKELRNALTVQIVLIAIVGSLIGILLAVITFEGFGDIVGSVAGLTWNLPVNISVAALTVLGIFMLVFIVARFISGAYKKITVLDALRGGISTHNFKKNLFSFENTPLPIPTVLSLKDTFGNLGRNVVMILISIILTVSTLIGFGLYENFGKDPNKLVELMGFESGSESVIGQKDMGGDLREIDGVKNVLGYYVIEPIIYFENNKDTVCTFVYDDVKNATQIRIVEGRIPVHDNEVMITGAQADDMGIGVGDIIEMEMGEEKAEYMVVGINQRMERMGRTIIMSFDAAEKIVSKIPMLNYNIQNEDGVSYETMKKRIEEYAEEHDISIESLMITNMSKEMESTIGTVTTALRAVCIVVALITVIVVIFVESLVIRAKITREWRSMGISKALGMTSGGLISQIMLSNTPSILMGILLGAIISQPAGSKICLVIFSLFGMKSIDFYIPFEWIIITVVGILAAAIITSGIMGLKVRRLKPVEMIVEE